MQILKRAIDGTSEQISVVDYVYSSPLDLVQWATAQSAPETEGNPGFQVILGEALDPTLGLQTSPPTVPQESYCLFAENGNLIRTNLLYVAPETPR